jgi:hypothetical protein
MWATQYTPNNDNVHVPGVLTDRRAFTDYSIDSTRNEQIKRENHITNNEEYRRFLVNNTSMIIQTNYESMIHQNNTNYGNNQPSNGPPKLYYTVQDDSKPFGYEDSVSKQMYLSREQINDKKRRLLKEEY